MKLLWWFVLFYSLGLICLLPVAKAIDEEEDPDDGIELEDDEPVIELNPAYVEPYERHFRSASNSSDDEYDDDEEEEEESGIEQATSKTVLGKALAKSRGTQRKAIKFVKKHHAKILVAMAVVAFRRELRKLLFYLVATPCVDPKTGQVTHREIRLRPTAILKVVLFVEMMRRVQQGSKPARLAAVFLAGNTNPILGAFMSKLLTPANLAYIPPIEQHFTFERINERYAKDGMALDKALSSTSTPQPFFASGQSLSPPWAMNATSTFLHTVQQPQNNGTVIILDLLGLDTRVSQLGTLRDEISFLLDQHRIRAAHQPTGTVASSNTTESSSSAFDTSKVSMEVVVLLESPGGSAQDYGLAAQQLLRLRNEPGIQVTICVDKVAASGGYMMACTATPGRLFVAPFAVVGSIGVIGQSINIHKVLEGWGVTPLVFRGGKDKAPLGLIGEVTDESIAKVQDMVDTIHTAFKQHVAAARPVISNRIDELATGDIWLGGTAVDVGLADRVVTSDEYIGERMRDGARVLKLIRYERPRFPFGISSSSRSGLVRSIFPIGLVQIVVLLQKLVGLLYSSLTNFKNRVPDVVWQ